MALNRFGLNCLDGGFSARGVKQILMVVWGVILVLIHDMSGEVVAPILKKHVRDSFTVCLGKNGHRKDVSAHSAKTSPCIIC